MDVELMRCLERKQREFREAQDSYDNREDR